jgi:hypothetical protein
MAYFFLWMAFAIAVGMFATQRGRSSGIWFLLSLIFSPLLGFIFLVASSNLNKIIENRDEVKCPACAELVLAEATVCKHCGGVLAPNPRLALSNRKARKDIAYKRAAADEIRVAAAIVVIGFLIYFWASRFGG